MVTEKMIEAAVVEMTRQDVTFANCYSGWQKRVMTRALEAALSTGAEPLKPEDIIADVKNFAHWHHLNEWTIKNGRKPSDSEIDFEVEAFRKIERAIKAHPAPSVAVKAIAPVDVYRAFAKFVEADTFDKDHVTVISRAVASALSAQVQDVAGTRTQAIEDVLSALTAHELYQYRPKAFQGFIDYARSELPAAPAAKPEGKP